MKQLRIPFILVALLFLLWGIANNMNDTLLAAFRRIMSMSDLQTSLVQFSFYGAYFCFALPAAIFISRFSYKAGILLGLALYALGTVLFYPAGIAASYPFFLFAIYVMAGGCAILETTANPYILSMGKPETATRRLNIAQTLNPLGAICGILLSRHFILSELRDADAAQRAVMDASSLSEMQQQELSAVSGTYLLIGCVLIALLVVIAMVKMPKDRDEGNFNILSSVRKLWVNRRWRYGVIAQFFYVGVQTGVWSFTIRLAMDRLGILEKDASMVFLYSIVAFSVFRFLFTWLMGYIRPVMLLAGASIAAIACTLGVIFADGWLSIWALVGISAFMSLMFPTIYGIALDGITGDDAKIAASGLIMAILGGALITPLQALISDCLGIGLSFSIPAVCFVIVFVYAFGIIKRKMQENKKVFVSGCYDMLHSGHVAFFKEASQYGDLYVGIGSDKTIEELKHHKTVYSEKERLYMVKAIRYVKDAFINPGSGMLDFVDTLDMVKPDIFVVNSDGGSDVKENSAQKEAYNMLNSKECLTTDSWRGPLPRFARMSSQIFLIVSISQAPGSISPMFRNMAPVGQLLCLSNRLWNSWNEAGCRHPQEMPPRKYGPTSSPTTMRRCLPDSFSVSRTILKIKVTSPALRMPSAYA